MINCFCFSLINLYDNHVRICCFPPPPCLIVNCTYPGVFIISSSAEYCFNNIEYKWPKFLLIIVCDLTSSIEDTAPESYMGVQQRLRIFTGITIRFDHDSAVVMCLGVRHPQWSIILHTTATFSSFKLPFYSEIPSNNQTTAVCNMKATSFQ